MEQELATFIRLLDKATRLLDDQTGEFGAAVRLRALTNVYRMLRLNIDK